MPVWRYDSNGDLEIDSASECSAETERHFDRFFTLYFLDVLYLCRWFLPGGVCLTDHQKRSLEFGSQFVDATGGNLNIVDVEPMKHVCTRSESPSEAFGPQASCLD